VDNFFIIECLYQIFWIIILHKIILSFYSTNIHPLQACLNHLILGHTGSFVPYWNHQIHFTLNLFILFTICAISFQMFAIWKNHHWLLKLLNFLSLISHHFDYLLLINLVNSILLILLNDYCLNWLDCWIKSNFHFECFSWFNYYYCFELILIKDLDHFF
jgi:hypothetical protein